MHADQNGFDSVRLARSSCSVFRIPHSPDLCPSVSIRGLTAFLRVKRSRLIGPAGVSHHHQAAGLPCGIKPPAFWLSPGDAYPTGRDPWDKTSSIRLGSGGAYLTGRDTPAAQRQQPSTIPVTRSRPFSTANQSRSPTEVQPILPAQRLAYFANFTKPGE
jgi:hypothetical protein